MNERPSKVGLLVCTAILLTSGLALSVPGGFWPLFGVAAAVALVPCAFGPRSYRFAGLLALSLSTSLIAWDYMRGQELAANPSWPYSQQARPAFSDELSDALRLADAGDAKGGATLLALLETGKARIDGLNGHLIPSALGRLKYQPAASVLARSLITPPKQNEYTAVTTLDALMEIGDSGVTNVLQLYLGTDLSPHVQAAARRVLIQLSETDPVPDLLVLLGRESYEPERSRIISTLTKHRDARVIKELAWIAAESGSAFMRREAILGLRDIGDRQSLLALTSLLDLTFSKELKADFGWKGIPDFRKYFPDTIAMCLKQCTKQDFGTNRTEWDKWIQDNVELDGAGDSSQTLSPHSISAPLEAGPPR